MIHETYSSLVKIHVGMAGMFTEMQLDFLLASHKLGSDTYQTTLRLQRIAHDVKYNRAVADLITGQAAVDYARLAAKVMESVSKAGGFS